MLSRRESEEIRSRGYASLHDVPMMSLLAGEPSWDAGLLSYFDGRVATISGYALRGDLNPTARSVRTAAERWVVDFGAESVLYVGPEPVDLRRLSRFGMRRTGIQPRRPSSEELALRNLLSSGARRLRAYRRSRRLPFQANVRRGGDGIRACDLALFERFYAAHDLCEHLADLAFAIPALLSAPWISILEARARGEVKGVLLFHRPFDNCIVAVTLARCPATPKVADFLLGALIDHACDMNVETISLGPSPSNGHRRFKLKWGGKPHVAPFYLVEWTRGPLSRRIFRGWGPRLVGLSP